MIAAAEKQAATQAQKDAAVAALVPDVVESLVTNGRITSDLREKAAAHLTDHVKALELLASVAAHRTDAELSHIGQPAGQVKKASARVGENSPYVGFNVSEDERPSGALLIERILGNR